MQATATLSLYIYIYVYSSRYSLPPAQIPGPVWLVPGLFNYQLIVHCTISPQTSIYWLIDLGVCLNVIQPEIYKSDTLKRTAAH
jgi:hypothetical protein